MSNRAFPHRRRDYLSESSRPRVWHNDRLLGNVRGQREPLGLDVQGLVPLCVSSSRNATLPHCNREQEQRVVSTKPSF